MIRWLINKLFPKKAKLPDFALLVPKYRDIENSFYEHEGPEIPSEINMPRIDSMSKPDSVDTQNVIIQDENGNDISVNFNQLAAMQPKVPDGLPGLSVPRRPPQQRPPQQQQPQQQPMQQQQPIQQQPIYQQPVYQQPQQIQQPMYQQPIQQQYQEPVYQQPIQQQQYQQPIQQQQPMQAPPIPPRAPIQAPVQRQPPYPPYELMTVDADSEYHLFLDLPGVDESQLNVDYAEGVVTISGFRESSIEIMRKEKDVDTSKLDPLSDVMTTVPKYMLNDFSFDFGFKKVIDETKITADYKNGRIHVTLPHRMKGDKVSIMIKK